MAGNSETNVPITNDIELAAEYRFQMKARPWTDKENDLTVATYFKMLKEELANRRYNKSAFRRELLPHLNQRTEPSIEFKFQNISAVLRALGEDSIKGYKPAFNFQMSLVDSVAKWLALNSSWVERIPSINNTETREPKALFLGPAPTLSNQAPPEELEMTLRIAQKFDVAQRDERNRNLGAAGEELVLAHEKMVLTSAGRPDLAKKVRWVSKDDGDGVGFDISSFSDQGKARLIEVKTTNGWERTPFYISKNELEVAEAYRSEWSLFRVWNFSREPKAFELFPPLNAHVSLTPMTFKASFQ